MSAHVETAPRPGARRLDRSRCLLLLIDVQERLTPHILDHDAVVARCAALLDAASIFAIPCLATEHCADQIGALVPLLRARFSAERIFAKAAFAATEHAAFMTLLRNCERSQVVVAGAEAHVCVLQTVLGMVGAGFDVFVVADAVGSRKTRQPDRDYALERMRAAGCVLLGTETALFEWAHRGDDTAFKETLALIKTLPGHPMC
jgi:nicotinamidase-related amidase